MPEIDFFLTDAEFADFVHDAVGRGFRVGIDRFYSDPKPAFVGPDNGITEAIRLSDGAFWLERSDFSQFPLQFKQIIRRGERAWYPRTVEGGPVIEVDYSAIYMGDGGRRIIPASCLAYHEMIEHPQTREPIPSGSAVADAFAEITAPITAGWRKITAALRTAWVSPGVEHKLERGWFLGAPFDQV